MAAVDCETQEASISYCRWNDRGCNPGNENDDMIERRNFICFIQPCFAETSVGSYLISSSLKIGDNDVYEKRGWGRGEGGIYVIGVE